MMKNKWTLRREALEADKEPSFITKVMPLFGGPRDTPSGYSMSVSLPRLKFLERPMEE